MLASIEVVDDVFGDYVAYTKALKDAGVLVGAEQLTAVYTATTVRLRGGRLLTDGRSIETKEHLLAFYLVVAVVPDEPPRAPSRLTRGGRPRGCR